MESIIEELIKQDEEGYLAAMKSSIVNYVMFRIDADMSVTSINEFTAKDIWDGLPEKYKELCVPVSYKPEEYIVTKDFYYKLKEVMENEPNKTL